MPKGCPQRQRGRFARGPRFRAKLTENPLLPDDADMTAARAAKKLAREMLEFPRTGRWVLEQETGERLDRFRRRCAALMH